MTKLASLRPSKRGKVSECDVQELQRWQQEISGTGGSENQAIWNGFDVSLDSILLHALIICLKHIHESGEVLVIHSSPITK